MKILLTLFVLLFSTSVVAGPISDLRCFYQGSKNLTLHYFGFQFGGLIFLIILFVIIYILIKLDTKGYIFSKKIKKDKPKNKKSKKFNWIEISGFVLLILYLYSSYRYC